MDVPFSSGHLVEADDSYAGPVTPPAGWESLVIDSVGNVIEFWGFKRNQGRVWALLYLRDVALSPPEIQATLDLSKGAVSMLTRELEQWQVIRRVRRPTESHWRFQANSDLVAMLNRVLQQREAAFIGRVKADLARAEREAKADPTVPKAVIERVKRMRRLAEVMERAVQTFIKTARLDVSGLIGVLQDSFRRAPNGGDR